MFRCYPVLVPRPFLVDTDTASDDAVALIMALIHPDARVLAITTAAGNVPVAQATRNALYVAELCGADVPVCAGSSKPLWCAYEDAIWFHGKDGQGDRGYRHRSGKPLTHTPSRRSSKSLGPTPVSFSSPWIR